MDTITQIPIEQLHESTANPRRTYSGIDELAASIRAEGRIHEPLLVRPRITNVLRPDEHDGFELVFGHRRLRAAEEAGLATVPCMVRGVRYRCPLTLSTWSGKGLQPAWLKAALASGKKLSDFDVSKGKEVARFAGKDDDSAGDAGARTADVDAVEEAEA